MATKTRKETILKLSKKLLANKQMLAVFILAILALLSLMIFGLYSIFPKTVEKSTSPVVIEVLEKISKYDNIPDHYVRRQIDGVYVEPELSDMYPIAVMIDNDPIARMQSGLAYAQLVYEVRAEAGITRFMAIFTDGVELDEVGPIRSARPYYVDWARGYDALYAHVGGSPEALEILRNVKMLNINEFFQGKYFWRSNNKIAPHNVYSKTKEFNAYLAKLNASNDGYDSWLYKDEGDVEDVMPSDIKIDYSVEDFLVEWKYNIKNNEYTRYMGGVQHKDADGTEIKAKNIIIMLVDAEVIDNEYRRRMTTVGSNTAWYCLDGVCTEGLWKKADQLTREKIYDLDDAEVAFNAGTTWVQVVQSEEDFSF